MEPNAWMQMAVPLFGLATVSSISMAVMRMAGVPRPPHWLTTSYVILAGAGLALSCVAAATVGIPVMAQLALLLLLFAATSDSLLNRLLHRHRVPKSFAVLRAFLAGAGFVLLVVSVYAQPYIARLPVPTLINGG